jgi:hypothetical protein
MGGGPISLSLFEKPIGESPVARPKLTSSSHFIRLKPMADFLDCLLYGDSPLSKEEYSCDFYIRGIKA